MECTKREDNKGMFLAVTARCEEDHMASGEKEPKRLVHSSPCVPGLKFNTQPDAVERGVVGLCFQQSPTCCHYSLSHSVTYTLSAII